LFEKVRNDFHSSVSLYVKRTEVSYLMMGTYQSE